MSVHPLLGGRANLVELQITGPLGLIEGVSLRLFDTQRQRWTLYYSNVTGGSLKLPMSGGFNGGGHGIFHGADTVKGMPILVRFVRRCGCGTLPLRAGLLRRWGRT